MFPCASPTWSFLGLELILGAEDREYWGHCIGFGTERPGLDGCVTLGKAHHHFLANMRWLGESQGPMSVSPKVPLLLLLCQGSLLSCVHTCSHVFTCTFVVVHLSLKEGMENEVSYLSLGLGEITCLPLGALHI